MSQNPAPPLFVGMIGAWVGLKFPSVVVVAATILGLVKIIPIITSWIRPHYESFLYKWDIVGSMVLSRWYRIRIRIIMLLRRVGMSKVADWVFGSETKR